MPARSNRAIWSILFSTAFVGALFLVHDAAERAQSGAKKYSPPPLPKPPTYSDLWPKEFGPIFKARIGSYSFEVPEKYFFYSQKNEDPGRVKDTLAFAFWYPDLRPALNHKGYYYDRRPVEPGRTVPRPSESLVSIAAGISVMPNPSIVSVAGGISVVTNPKRPYPPKADLDRTLNAFGGENGRFDKQNYSIYGLTFFKDELAIEDYYFKEDNLIQRRIVCHVQADSINKNCGSILFHKRLNIKVGFSFASDQLPIWEKLESATIELLRKFMTSQPKNSP